MQVFVSRISWQCEFFNLMKRFNFKTPIQDAARRLLLKNSSYNQAQWFMPVIAWEAEEGRLVEARISRLARQHNETCLYKKFLKTRHCGALLWP